TIHYGGATPPAGAWLLAGWLASRLGWTPRDRRGTRYRFDAAGKSATIALERDEDARLPLISAVPLPARETPPPRRLLSHEGRAPSATVTFVAPFSRTLERRFAYREFAACLIGEIQRHEANAALDAAAPVAVALAAMASS